MLRPALMQLVDEADSALKAGPFSVMQKKRVPPSGDRHDYISLGPYWWPDSSKPGGLPYIRKDGHRNPRTQDDYDAPRLRRMADAVTTLALAYYFTEREAYARHAALLLRTWFVDTATRMNPHLEFGQEIPGITTGRGIGIIETRGLARLLDAVALLERSASWTAHDRPELRSWMAAYLNWLRTSNHGRDERAAQNNHGTWYDVQTAALALFVGQTALASEIVEASKTRRIAAQIEPDGRQPLELARTRSWDYSVMNLEGLMQLAELGRTAGVDLWHYVSPDGRSIRKALDYLSAYQASSRTWTRQQITPVSPIRLLEALTLGQLVYGDSTYSVLIRKMPRQQLRVSRLRLLYQPDGTLTHDLEIHTGNHTP